MCARMPFNKISVSELTQVAGVNRKTFYLHYTALDDLLDDVEDHIVAEIREQFSDDTSDRGIAADIYTLYTYLHGHSDVMHPLLTDYTYDHFARRFRHDILTSDCFTPLYGTNPKEAPLKEGYCTCIFSIYEAWARDNSSKLTRRTLANKSADLVLHGF